MKKYYLTFIVLLGTLMASAQMPDFSGPGKGLIYYLVDSGGIYRIYNYDPTLPISPGNPTLNTIIPPTGAQGLAVSTNLNAPGPSPTFYTTVGNVYYWYNGTTWVNTGDTVNHSGWYGIGAGGGYIYNISETDSSIYQYDGTGDATLLTHITGMGPGGISGPRDIVADDSGNCYVVLLNSSVKWLRKYNKYGTLLHTWTINGMYHTSTECLAIIGNNIYTHDGGHRFTGNIYENDVDIISAGSLSPLYPHPTDYACRPTPGTPGTPIASCGSFKSYVNKFCAGPEVSAVTPTYTSGLGVKTYFGDGLTDSGAITNSFGKGVAIINHSYSNSGTYAIKQILYLGATKVDSLVFSYQHTLCATIGVKFYHDNNGNCIKENLETYIAVPSLIKVDCNGTEVTKISATSGFYYRTNGSPGDVYTFKVISAPGGTTFTCPASGIFSYTMSPTPGSYDTTYVGYSCTTSPSPDIAGHLSGRYGRHIAFSNILVDNTQCTGIASTLTLQHSPKYVFSWASLPPSSVVGNTVTWNLPAISNITSVLNIRVHYDHPGPMLVMGDTVNTSITLSPTTGDLNPANNICVIIDTVTGSFDPNAKVVRPDGIIPPGQQLEYTIMFENMGNDTAFDIHVLDTLPDHLDVGSFRIVGASATMYVSMLKDSLGHNVIKFDFPGINLLDSSHHDLCNGAVVFTINAKSGLPNGTNIFNRAGIYFDNNPVVLTNMTQNVVGSPNKINWIHSNHKINVYPNPVTSILTIDGVEACSFIQITDLLGRELYYEIAISASHIVDTKIFPKGVYLLHMGFKDGEEVHRIIKE